MSDEWNRITIKSLRRVIELIERLIACDPKRTIVIFEESSNIYAIEAVGVSCVANEKFEGIAVVPVQSKPRSKPHETLVVLNNVIYFCLRYSVGCIET